MVNGMARRIAGCAAGLDRPRVRSWRQTGRHLLDPSLTAYDPKRTQGSRSPLREFLFKEEPSLTEELVAVLFHHHEVCRFANLGKPSNRCIDQFCKHLASERGGINTIPLTGNHKGGRPYS